MTNEPLLAWCGSLKCHPLHVDEERGTTCLGIVAPLERRDFFDDGFYPSPFQPSVHEPINWKSKPEPFRIADGNDYLEYTIDVADIVSDMLRRITAAEESIRERVMVEWLRAHGWKVMRDEADQ